MAPARVGEGALMACEDRHAALTATERCTLTRLIEGDEPQQIALARGVSLRTVRNQIASIHRKLDLSRTHPDVVNWGREHLQCCVRPWEFVQPDDAPRE
jgi:DNA-binding CsgD family transcriptional regulator